MIDFLFPNRPSARRAAQERAAILANAEYAERRLRLALAMRRRMYTMPASSVGYRKHLAS